MTTSQLTEELAALPPNLQEVREFVTTLIAKGSPQPESPLQKRQFGAGKGFCTMSENFDEPLEDFKGYM